MLPMPITQFRKRVEAILTSSWHNVTVTDEIRRVIRECWEDHWDVKHTAKLIIKQTKP